VTPQAGGIVDVETLDVLDVLDWKPEHFMVFSYFVGSVRHMCITHALSGITQEGTSTGGSVKLLRQSLLRALLDRVLDWEEGRDQ
jgi:hypothetical protein